LNRALRQVKAWAAEDHGPGSGGNVAGGVGIRELVGDGRDDDPSHHRHMEVGVGRASQAARVVAGRDHIACEPSPAIEVDPPQRHAAGERHHERCHRAHRRRDAASLVMSATLPEAFDERGLGFASAYVMIQVGRTVVVLLLLGRDHQLTPMGPDRQTWRR
jgi:hypothetical protein